MPKYFANAKGPPLLIDGRTAPGCHRRPLDDGDFGDADVTQSIQYRFDALDGLGAGRFTAGGVLGHAIRPVQLIGSRAGRRLQRGIGSESHKRVCQLPGDVGKMRFEMNAYDELVDVIATGPAAERILQFRASDENQRRVADLLTREGGTKGTSLNM